MNQKGFTLIEMLVVLLVISVLLIITIPNIVKQQGTIRDKGCAALEKMVQGQVQAYQIDYDKLPASLSAMKSEGYINNDTCPNGDKLHYNSVDGTVKASKQDG
ncbi:MAG: competence type IV pilus major pilin ComGC [Bacillus sp. (in: firmicutes)]